MQQTEFWNVEVNLVVYEREMADSWIHFSWWRYLMLWQFNNAQFGFKDISNNQLCFLSSKILTNALKIVTQGQPSENLLVAW